MATNGPKKSIMQLLEEDAAEKIAKNPKSKSISEILQEDALQQSRYPDKQMKDPFYRGNRETEANRMKFDYNHQRPPSVPMYQSGPRGGPPPMPPMAPFPPYPHPIPPDSGMYMHPPMPPGQIPPPHPQQMPPPPLPLQQMPQPPMHPHHPHHPHMAPPPMLPPPYAPVPPHTVHYMQPPGPPIPITQSHHAFQPLPPLPAQNPPVAPPAPPPAPLIAPLPPDAPPLPPLPPSEPPLPPPPKEPPPTSPVKKSSVKQAIDAKTASVGLSQNHKNILSGPHSPDEYNMTVGTPHIIPTIPLTSVKTTPRASSKTVSEIHQRSSPQLPKSNSSTVAQSHPNQSSSYPNMAPSKKVMNMGHHHSHQPVVPGQHYHHGHGGPSSAAAELYDPEAVFSPTSSVDDSPIKDQAKKDDSLIEKHVRDFSSKSSAKAAIESQNSPDKKVSFAPDTKKESPVRIDLDSRLKMMFGAGGSNPSSKTAEKEPVKMPAPMADRGRGKTSESVPGIQTASDDRPLSPPPSPFLSKKIYLYWHAETIRVRKASKHSATDFVTAGSSKTHSSTSSKSRSHESARGTEVRANGQQGSMAPPPPANFLPTVPPPSYKNLSQDTMQGRNMKADSSLKNSTNVQFHPYKRTSDVVSNVNNNSISKNNQSLHSNNSKLDSDSELELTCQKPKSVCKTEPMKPVDITKSENKTSVNVAETKKVPAVSDSFLKAKTVGLVMSKILAELRQTIRQEIVKKLLDDDLMDTTESGLSS